MIKKGASWGEVNKLLRTLSPSIRKKIIPKIKAMKSKAGTDLARGLRRTKKDLLSKEGIDRYRREYLRKIDQDYPKKFKYTEGTWNKTRTQYRPGDEIKLPDSALRRRKIEYANSPQFVKDYIAMVNRQLDDTVGEVLPELANYGRRAQYFMKHRPENTLKRITPKDVLRGDKEYGSLIKPTVKGRVQIAGPHPQITSSPVSSAAHEFKHATQPGLKAYYTNAQKHVPQHKRVLAKDDPYMKEILQPHEISARLTEARTANIGEKLRIANQQHPEWYRDLLATFGSPQKINKALKDNWAIAPIGGLLSQLEG
jgi:hypothetical protein